MENSIEMAMEYFIKRVEGLEEVNEDQKVMLQEQSSLIDRLREENQELQKLIVNNSKKLNGKIAIDSFEIATILERKESKLIEYLFNKIIEGGN